MIDPTPSPPDRPGTAVDAALDDDLDDPDLVAPRRGPVDAATEDEDEDEDESPSLARNLAEWVAILLGALVVALLVTRFLVQAFFIPSLSMAPTLENNDRVLVNKLSYDLHDVNRGDVIVFERPPQEAESDIKDLIKRVVALPGDTIADQDGRLIINGAPLEEPYLQPGDTTTNVAPQTIPAGHVFVMGDNRNDSRDSRYFGPLSEDLIVGRAFVKVWPLTDLSLL